MFLGLKRKTKFKKSFLKKLLFITTVTGVINFNSNLVSQSISDSNFNKNTIIYSKKSFITKAIEKTGASVVTIDTQKLVKERNSSGGTRIFLDPYFEKFFGLNIPYENRV